VIGAAPAGHLGQSLWLREIGGREDGPPPSVDLEAEREAGDLVRRLIRDGAVSAVHDVSDGGLLVAVAEMAMAGNLGAILEADASLPSHAWAFGEDQGRYVVTAPRGWFAQIPTIARRIGTTGGDALVLPEGRSIPIRQLRHAHESFFPTLMGKELAVA
jgi:phosphoribosylformylglycinamidine synthase subunit PurL